MNDNGRPDEGRPFAVRVQVAISETAFPDEPTARSYSSSSGGSGSPDCLNEVIGLTAAVKPGYPEPSASFTWWIGDTYVGN